jgi:hypothetical protein
MRIMSDPESTGFQRVGVVKVALPHFVWKVDVDVEFDRDVRLVEETVLGLVAVGVGAPDRIAELMGLDDGRILTSTVVELLRRGLLGHRDGSLTISTTGKDVLSVSRSREVRRREDVELRHDPYRNELKWALAEHELKKESVEREGIHALPTPSAMSPTRLESRYADLQALVDREGFPWDSPDDRKFNEKRRREIVRLSALKCYVAYREATLEVWRHPERTEWQWRLIGGESEHPEVAAQMAALESEGHDIVPLQTLSEWELGPKGLELQDVASTLMTVEAAQALDISDATSALYEAVTEAEGHLILVAPWLPNARVDPDFVGTIQQTLQRNPNLRATIACCAPDKTGQPQGVVRRQQEAALRDLMNMAQRVRSVRIIEIGNAAETMVIADDRHALLVRAALVPCEPKPGKGLLQKTAFRIDDAAAVTAARIRVGALLAD